MIEKVIPQLKILIFHLELHDELIEFSSLCIFESLYLRRHRGVKPPGYEVVESSITINDTALSAQLKSKDLILDLFVFALEDSTFRILIDESKGTIRQRYRPLDSLKEKEPKQQKFKSSKTNKTVSVIVTHDDDRVDITHSPFRIDLYSKDTLVVSINSGGLLMVEPFKKKVFLSDREKGYWEETFKGHKDTKPFGSSSVGIDIAWIGMNFVYGLPEHAESFALRDTRNYEPYRLYNLDVFEYDLNSPMALYGSVPYMVALNPKRTIGLLWLNAAETWVDIEYTTADKGILAKVVADSDIHAKEVRQINSHFISETGVIEVFVTLGPQPQDSVRQLATLIGVYSLPPEFSIAYHQSRWNYNDQKDVKEVHDGFDEHDIPFDVMWLDIEHTDGKRYFTWDPRTFPNPLEMIADLSSKGRKLVTVVDPHIKTDSEYFVYAEAKKYVSATFS
ncbi:unnamed protein product [Haemonchus placei]|uniref:Gal_mutarotas_2 domain-containing protein n=1 Tax=Haemonchus placei TaxID=6290 RepID=A0A158QR19_HAEPC|nr:unnamed protein product [Haemonchus placei]